MNAPTKPIGQFAWYMEALAGHRGDFDTRNPPSGYYRDRDRSLAVWRDDDGTLRWSVSHGFSPRYLEQLCDAFATFCMHPVSYDDWERHSETGQWPESVKDEIETARAEVASIGHNSGSAEEIARDELAALDRAYSDWLESQGGRIDTEERSLKAKSFQDRALALKKELKARHELEKAPHLQKCREIDAAWGQSGLAGSADGLQRRIGADRTPFLQEKDRRQREAENIAREQAAKLKAEAAAANRPAPIVQAPRKEATGLRPHYSAEITDLGKAAEYLASLKAPALIEVVEKLSLKLLRDGVMVPGAKLNAEMRA